MAPPVSVDAVQDRSIWTGLEAVAVKLVGAVGAVPAALKVANCMTQGPALVSGCGRVVGTRLRSQRILRKVRVRAG